MPPSCATARPSFLMISPPGCRGRPMIRRPTMLAGMPPPAGIRVWACREPSRPDWICSMTAVEEPRTHFVRPDGHEKVTGSGRYTADLTFTGEAYAAFRYADHPHARIA